MILANLEPGESSPMARIAARLSLLALILVAGIAPARATDMMTGSEIKTLLAGNTVTGAMDESGSYSEFYQSDGVIKGDGYVGAWTVSEDSACFQYGDDARKCLRVGRNGEQIQWFNGRRVAGTGMILLGNPNNY
jgi:hypothetical protein